MFKIIVAVLALSAVCSNVFASEDLDSLEHVRNIRELLDRMKREILLTEYNNVPTEDGYKFNYETDDGSKREEVGVIMNPGTENQELVVMGAYEYQDENIHTMTMYTADKNGYKPRVTLKNRKLNPKLLASLAG